MEREPIYISPGEDNHDVMERLREHYSARRSIAAQFVNDAITVMEREIDHQVREAKIEMAREAGLAKARHEREVDVLERRLAHADRAIEALEKRVTALSRENALVEDQVLEGDPCVGDRVRVSISKGSDLTVADLEECAYRLRVGGAQDDTPVSLSRRAVAGVVSSPNVMVLSLEDRSSSLRPSPAAESVEIVPSPEAERIGNIALFCTLVVVVLAAIVISTSVALS